MTFDNPKGFFPAQIIRNPQLDYEYAITVPGRRFEMRFAVMPMDKLIAEYEEKERNKKQRVDITIFKTFLSNRPFRPP